MAILKICVKCSDRFTAILVEGNNILSDFEGYVPDFMPEDHYGDYIELDIDIETGKIINWTFPTLKQVKEQLK